MEEQGDAVLPVEEDARPHGVMAVSLRSHCSNISQHVFPPNRLEVEAVPTSPTQANFCLLAAQAPN